MSLRYYCPQACSNMRGWTDLPSLAAKTEMEAVRNLDEWIKFRQPFYSIPATRVIRKPKGWVPEENNSANEKTDLLQRAHDIAEARFSICSRLPETAPKHLVSYYCQPPAGDPVGVCMTDKNGDLYTMDKDAVTCELCAAAILLSREELVYTA